MAQTHFSGPVVIGAGQFEAVTAAKTLSAADWGKTFLVATTGYTHTLPAPEAGASVRYVTSVAFGTDMVIAGGNSLFHGAVDVNSARINATAASNVNMIGTADTIGDWVEIWSDGTNWYVDGFGEAIGAITTT